MSETLTTPAAPSITVQELAERACREDIDLIDVRTPAEFEEVHAVAARNVPLHTLDPDAVMNDRCPDSNRPLYVICKAGGRSAQAQQKFLEAGYSCVVNVEGGTDAWCAAGLPVQRGRRTMSLERQVRITAGFLVLVSGLLAIFVHPYWAALAAATGAGLMHAGITDSCLMGMIMARMPWNQAGPAANGSCCSAD